MLPRQDPNSGVEFQHPVATAPGSVTEPRAVRALPSPVHAVKPRQLVEKGAQLRPFSLSFPVSLQTIAAHELIDLRGAIQHCLHVAGGGLVTVKVIVQLLSLFVEVFDEGIDVVFSPRAVKAALIQS